MTDPSPPTRRTRQEAPEPTAAPVDPRRPWMVPAGERPEVADDDPERLPTAQLEMAAFGDHLIPYVPPAPKPPPSLAPWALAVAILALAAALITGWLLPLGVAGAILTAISLRRAHDSRRVAGWALSLSLLAVAFSAGWLVWGFSQLAVG
ncbi:hypothetical protein SAMN04487848_1080 [Microbacterium sp. ru370.1]|uniref:hypothetical protein n=1 Tax=unclassified Microbacterium TaxID=2609290 RepID=UPI00088D1C2C|nr:MULTISPECIES: hypothetical protein [unclassified Microbacterium]SDO47671.1 hypothetical protein SAMN04487848_1080 [Microbacterium sp. ru370.1]SIT82201.1 hypothetical protein SAMN05880579_1076 [Microbacterium sp. RU1D]